jgi:hypothetical protein
VGRPLWREVGSVVFGFCIASAAFHISESHGTHEHILLSLFLKFSQPLGLSVRAQYSNLCSTNSSHVQVQVQVILRPTVSPIVRLGVGNPWSRWPDFKFLWVTSIFFLFHVGSPLWREDWSVICSAITHRLESRRTHDRILVLLSHLRLSQSGGSDPRIYSPKSRLA